jgi:hypothetical protein
MAAQNRFPTLKELAAQKEGIDLKEYGLKTEGLVELLRAQRLFSHPVEESQQLYVVPDGFVTPLSAPLEDSTRLRNSFNALVEGVNNYAVVLSRSSADDEEPGQLETTFTLFDPREPERSYHDFVEDHLYMRQEPRKPAIVQLMVGEVQNYAALRYEKGSRPVIGYNNTSFTSRSHSHIDTGLGVINVCYGLTTRLVRDANEAVLLPFRRCDGLSPKYQAERFSEFTTPILLGHDYRGHSLIQSHGQSVCDLYDIASRAIITDSCDDEGDIAEIKHAPWTVQKGISEYADGIRALTEYFSSKFSVPVELEGCVHNDIMYLYQLTKSHHLPDVIERLTPISPEQRILESNTIGSITFRGDLMLCCDEAPAQPTLPGTLPCTAEFDDKLVNALKEKNYIAMSTIEGICSSLGHDRGYGFIATHALGYINSQLHKRRLKGHKACHFLKEPWFHGFATADLGEYSSRRIVDEARRTITYKGVGVEACASRGQIYFL